MTASEIRERIIEVVAKNGGHLAPSLGAVEIAIALSEVFDPEKDRIIWDVGHQAYAWKLLTGRDAQFATLRTLGGISGFPIRLSRMRTPQSQVTQALRYRLRKGMPRPTDF